MSPNPRPLAPNRKTVSVHREFLQQDCYSGEHTRVGKQGILGTCANALHRPSDFSQQPAGARPYSLPFSESREEAVPEGCLKRMRVMWRSCLCDSARTGDSEDAGMEDSRRYPGDILRSLPSGSANQWIFTVDQTCFYRKEVPVGTINH